VKSSSNPQTALKPQDLLVLLKIAIRPGAFTYAALGSELFLSASEVHASLARAKLARLVSDEAGPNARIVRASLREFVVYGARYAFPPILGSLTRGFPTAYAAPVLRDQLTATDEPVPVWPYSKGTARGMALQPLYPSVPRAAELDPKLYDALALFDALRIGAARERDLAVALLTGILA
jgi:hypothetical protein